jgi:hypothetical protein
MELVRLHRRRSLGYIHVDPLNHMGWIYVGSSLPLQSILRSDKLDQSTNLDGIHVCVECYRLYTLMVLELIHNGPNQLSFESPRILL